MSVTTIPLLFEDLAIVAWVATDEGIILGPTTPFQAAISGVEDDLIFRLWFNIRNTSGQTVRASNIDITIGGIPRTKPIKKVVMRHDDTLELTYDLRGEFQ